METLELVARLIFAARRLSESCHDNEGSLAAEGGDHEQSHDHDAKRELDRLLAQWDARKSSKPRSWWPLCAKCGKVVESLELVPIPENPTPIQRSIRDFTVRCHGETEESHAGVWAAFELASEGKRLPDAFNGNP